jgi:hypothetical protein
MSMANGCMTSGFRHGVNEIFAPLECRQLVTDLSRQPVRPILESQAVQKDIPKNVLLDLGMSTRTALLLKMEPIGCLETSVTSNLRCVRFQSNEALN